jgi:feruloyl esterase
MRPLALAFASLACAQNAPHIRDWKPPASETLTAPKATCRSLHRLTGYDLSILTAVEANGFCRVMALAQPEILIEVSLPREWNQRLYMFGNGGFAGENLEDPGRVARRDAALRLGFAVVQTNTGHDAQREPLASFALNPQKLYDWGFRSLPVTAETGKRLAAAFYGQRPRRSYYNGCSTGGRQGLMFAQRYPEAFDGIIAGAPAFDQAANRMRSISNAQALAKTPIPASKLPTLAKYVYEKCDATDGLKDGLIGDPRLCNFEPRGDLAACQGCFTDAEIETLEKLYREVRNNAKRLAPAWPVGAEIAGPNGVSGWDGWILRDGSIGQGARYAESALRYYVFGKFLPDYHLTGFNFDRDAAHMERHVALSATDTDLAAFRDRGGKLLMYFGWADPALNPMLAVEYYDQVQQSLGPGTADFFRFYLMPGVFHCAGGVGPASFDPLAAVIGWVEGGRAPEALIASREEGGKVLRTRPLCPHPQVARYKGQGSSDEASSFTCSPPR